MKMKLGGRPACACLLLALAVGQNALAGGLQISPVNLTLSAAQNADGIWLSNEGTAPLNAQVRVFNWQQSGNADRLSTSQGLVISPPIVTLPAGERQLVRVIRTTPATNQVEQAYRLFIDELPPAKVQKNTIQYVMRYSVPVFLQPVGQAENTAKLKWALVQTDGKTFVDVSNQGNSHAQLSAMTFIQANGARKTITPGLLGYVLPGSTMRWIISSSASDAYHSGKVEVTINGQKTEQNL
ncbi:MULTISPECIES: fimbrial biogenesis chaperone [Enterobacteriaceae]|uniref:fimbrial biogenesis chaperone n=1 Tax=Enterobacteriaceae TaxID=543 RepID=UPI0002729D76|nr:MULTISPECIES: molecular chaperone [Enterobacteriaceae]EJF32894.1 P pilus assembly protein chaperone PapD-like protein [Enterobacter sp. Ag1]